MWQWLEGDQHLFATFPERLAGPQPEGHAGPSPVVDLNDELCQRLGVSRRIDAGLRGVIRYVSAVDRALGIAGSTAGRDGVVIPRPAGAQHLGLGVA